MNTLANISYKTLLTLCCPIITLIPVLAFIWSNSGESLLTLIAWFVSNLLMQVLLHLISRMERLSVKEAK